MFIVPFYAIFGAQAKKTKLSSRASAVGPAIATGAFFNQMQKKVTRLR
jgi:hypothetical protein